MMEEKELRIEEGVLPLLVFEENEKNCCILMQTIFSHPIAHLSVGYDYQYYRY